MALMRVFNSLLNHYGPQGWWPLQDYSKPENPGGYHPADYSLPETPSQRYEIILGSILTQNTTWKNVQGIIRTLYINGLLDVGKIIDIPYKELTQMIKPSGYFNQKAKKIKVISQFFSVSNYLKEGKYPERDKLLELWGVGPETADSILLYAFKKPYFVVDAYTKRILSRLGYILQDESYKEVQDFVSEKLNQSTELYNEFHALFVMHAKEHCRKKPICEKCPLKKNCSSVP
jgi:endonuclease-3 related protein